MSPRKRRSVRQALALAALVSVSIAGAGCRNSLFYNALGNKVSVPMLTISPTSVTVPVNGTIAFTASGGVPPYTYSMVSGFGSINSSTGTYLASATPSPPAETVQVKDKQGSISQATVTVTQPSGPVTIVPPSVSLNAGGTMTFIATGGTGPYTFSIQTAGSAPPMPTVNSTTGAYTAGSSIGSDTVKVNDSVSGTSTATVNVTLAVTGVDYKIPSQTLPSSGIGGTALPGGYSFAIQNGGTANGSQTISWWVFLSPNPVPGSGTILLQSGTTAALGAGASTSIPLAWTWPSVPPVLPGPTRYLYIMISAADDLTTANNTYAGPALTVSPPNIDYTVASVSSTGGTLGGGAITGSFTLQNSGTANGSQAVSWTAYVSTDSTATIDAGAIVVDSGSTGALTAGGTQGVPFAGTWPATAGTYYLKVRVASADEVNTTNDVQVSPGYLTTNVDYAVTAVNNTGGLIAGAALSGNFTVINSGTANGTQTVSWEVYASTSSTLGAGSILVASGSTAPLNVGQSSTPVFAGTWPSTAGTYYLIAKVAASDELNTANNVLASSALTVNPANVDYTVTSVAYTGATPPPPIPPAGAMTGSLQFSNIGANNGTQYVTWQVYASKLSTLDGTAVLVASGSSPALASGASSSVISFSGSWPLVFGNYYLIAKVTVAGDVDTNLTNNVLATTTTTPVGFYAAIEPNDDSVNLTNATNLPPTLRPGMSISVTGSLTSIDTYDVYSVNTGTAASVTFSMSWSAFRNANLYVDSGPGPVTIDSTSVTNLKSLSLFWTVDIANTTRWIALQQGAGSNVGSYTLVITAN